MTSLRTILSAFCLVANSYGTILSTSDVSKCCKLNETLNARQECETTNRTGWEYNYRHFNYTSQSPVLGFGSWSLVENKVPNCEKRITFPVQPLSVIIDGDLYSAILNRRLSQSEFCVDMDYILVCDKFLGNKTLVNRCCGKRAIYSNETKSCKHISKENEILVGENVFFKDFLPCDEIVTVGTVSNETKLYDNGSFEVMNQLYPHESFCLEYISEEVIKPINMA
ncbi:hypothetical protein Trydic_g17859 [Trypoxylus dichotomus]